MTSVSKVGVKERNVPTWYLLVSQDSPESQIQYGAQDAKSVCTHALKMVSLSTYLFVRVCKSPGCRRISPTGLLVMRGTLRECHSVIKERANLTKTSSGEQS